MKERLMHILHSIPPVWMAASATIFIAAVIIIPLSATSNAADESSQSEVKAVTMTQTITGAGEITSAQVKKVDFDTDTVFLGMCVEEGDLVTEGQHLISYSDGSYTDAPMDGIISSVEVPKTGTYASDESITISSVDELLLNISVPEDEIDHVETGSLAEIVVNSDTSSVYEGKVVSVKAISGKLLDSMTNSDEEAEEEASEEEGIQAESKTETNAGSESFYTAAIKFKNDGNLKTGMSANATITISDRKSVLAVPIEAVQFDESDQAYVQRIDGDKITKTKVGTGESDANYVEITKGLQAGDLVQIGGESK